MCTEEDEQLKRFEQSAHFRPKVGLPAQVVRLNAAGWSRRRIAQHTGRSYGTVCQDLKRWHGCGVAGLADAPATNRAEKLTLEMAKLVLEKLQEDRTWTCRQLVEAVKQRFAVDVSVEAMRKRVRVREPGYC